MTDTTSHAAVLAAMEDQDRANVRALMIGDPDGEQGMNGLAAVLRTVTPASSTEPYDEDAHGLLLRLVDYAFGFALALNGERVPSGARQAVVDGFAAGQLARRRRVDPAPVERFAR